MQQATVELNLASTRSNIASLESQRNKARDEVELTRSRLAKMELKRPPAGVVNLLVNQSQGWFNAKPFKVGDSVWPGVGIAEIPDLASLRLKGKAEEIDRGRMVVAQAARVVLDPFPEKTFLGQLESISPLAEATFEWPPARTFRVMASLGSADDRLRPGMNGRMDVIVDRIPDAISVPAKAIFAHDGRPVVLEPGKQGLRRVRVEILARNPDEVAIRGVEAGTQVALVDVLAAEAEQEEPGQGLRGEGQMKGFSARFCPWPAPCSCSARWLSWRPVSTSFSRQLPPPSRRPRGCGGATSHSPCMPTALCRAAIRKWWSRR